MQGLNIKIRYWQFKTLGYDDVGGVTGGYTELLSDTPARLETKRPSLQSLEAGLEVPRMFSLIIPGQKISQIFERDEIEVTWPTNHPNYCDRFRITNIQPDSRNPKRGHTEFILSRIEKSRSRQ